MITFFQDEPDRPIELYPNLDFADALLGEEICPQFEEDPLKLEPAEPKFESDESKIEPDDLKIESYDPVMEIDAPKIKSDPDYHPPSSESSEHNDVDDNQECTTWPKHKTTTGQEQITVAN